jgi:hypothetical protein
MKNSKYLNADKMTSIYAIDALNAAFVELNTTDVAKIKTRAAAIFKQTQGFAPSFFAWQEACKNYFSA